MLLLYLAIPVLIALVNPCGTYESGLVFLLPT